MNAGAISASQKEPQESKKKLSERFCFKNLLDFFLSTYMHGLKYLADSNLTIYEKGYFFLLFGMSLAFGLYQSLYVLDRWQNTPVIMATDASTTTIMGIPFPALTICNMNLIKKSKAVQFPPNSTEYAMLSRMCFIDNVDYTKFRNTTPSRKNSFLKFNIENKQPCAEMLLNCKYDNKIFTCTDLFREVMSDEGVCCIFNSLHPYFIFKGDYYLINQLTSTDGQAAAAVSWHPENGYPKPLPKHFYPRSVKGAGLSRGLSIVLNADINEYYCSSTNGAGFKALLYNPVNEPDMRDSGLPIIIGQQSEIRIDIKSFEADLNLKTTHPKRRQCYFANEKRLYYHNIYTRRSCERECDSLFYYKTCNCIPLYLPRIFSNTSTCDIQHFSCVVPAERNIYTSNSTSNCKAECLPACFDISYYPDILTTKFQKYPLQDSFLTNFSMDYAEQNLAIAHLYFEDEYFRSVVRQTYTGLTEYLSLTGGIMSLVVGFSVITLVELFYFLVVQPSFHTLRNKILLPDAQEESVDPDEEYENRFRNLENNPFRMKLLSKQNKY